jgi:hypothetical protein
VSKTRAPSFPTVVFPAASGLATLHGVVFDILAARTFAEAVSALYARASGVLAQRLTLPVGR